MEATNLFTGIADGYSKYRPSYPREYVDYLITHMHITPNHTVADIGSGTGILTQQLLDRNLKVFAVEPNEDMRKTAEHALQHYQGFVSIKISSGQSANEY